MKRVTRLLAAMVLGIAGLAGAAALAQGPAPGMMGGGSIDTGWLDAAKARLGITAGQDKAWAAYADAVRSNVQSMRDMHDSMDPAAIRKMSPDERQQFMQGVHDSRIEQMNAVSQARDALFKVLDDRQKQLAATLPGPNRGGPGGTTRP